MKHILDSAQSGGNGKQHAGTQVLRRAFSVLRVVAAGEGLRLSDIAQRSNLHVATVHRLLRDLCDEGMISFDPYARLYHLANGFPGRSEGPFDQLKQHFGGLVRQLAIETGDVVYLVVRQGWDTVCIDRASGACMQSCLTLPIGGRRPVGIGSGGLVLLASMSAADIGRALRTNESRYLSYRRTTPLKVREQVRNYLRKGYAYHLGAVLDGVGGVGVPLHDDSGQVIAAISFATSVERLPWRRAGAVAALIREEAQKIPPLPGSGAHSSRVGYH